MAQKASKRQGKPESAVGNAVINLVDERRFEKSVSISSDQFDHEAFRKRIAKMTDSELIRHGTAARGMSRPLRLFTSDTDSTINYVQW